MILLCILFYIRAVRHYACYIIKHFLTFSKHYFKRILYICFTFSLRSIYNVFILNFTKGGFL